MRRTRVKSFSDEWFFFWCCYFLLSPAKRKTIFRNIGDRSRTSLVCAPTDKLIDFILALAFRFQTNRLQTEFLKLLELNKEHVKTNIRSLYQNWRWMAVTSFTRVCKKGNFVKYRTHAAIPLYILYTTALSITVLCQLMIERYICVRISGYTKPDKWQTMEEKQANAVCF